MHLTLEQQQALDRAAAPPRITEPGGEQIHVLLRSEDFDWIRERVRDVPDAPRAIDPRTQVGYALIPIGVYERFQAFFEEDPLSRDEQIELLRQAAAGWDDPEMDVYNDLDPRRQP